MGYSLWGCKELDTTEWLIFLLSLSGTDDETESQKGFSNELKNLHLLSVELGFEPWAVYT